MPSMRHGGRNTRPILLQGENEKACDNIEDVQFMMKYSHEKRGYAQHGVDLLMFFHKNER